MAYGCQLFMMIHESAENYLEMILILQNKTGFVRSIDIAHALEVSKPSVSVAMKNLKNNGYIEIDEAGKISLLPMGQEIADKIYERHTFFTKFLTKLGVPEEIAEKDACKIEHDISIESFNAIKKHAADTISDF